MGITWVPNPKYEAILFRPLFNLDAKAGKNKCDCLDATDRRTHACNCRVVEIPPMTVWIQAHANHVDLFGFCRNRCKFLNIDSLSHRLVVGLLIKAIQTL